MPNAHTFPWGVYIRDLIHKDDSLPVCLPSETGGFCILFDEQSETPNNYHK